jgi:hypothetical protein
MATYLGIPRQRIRVVPIGISLDGHAPVPVRREPPYNRRLFRAHRARKKACTC